MRICSNLARPFVANVGYVTVFRAGLDYHAPMMVLPLYSRAATLACAVAFGVFSAHAQLPPQATPADPPATLEAAHADIHNSALDADLFYGLLLSELMYGRGQHSLGYDLMLEAARRSGEAQLYRRATEMALELRSDKHALIAVSAWLQAQPQSREANRYMLQILLIINRVADTIGPLQQEWSQASESEKIDLLHALPQLYLRVSDKAMAARVVEQALAADLADPNTSPLVWVTVGRMRWIASDLPGALQAARRAHALNAFDESVAELALGLMDEGLAEAEPLLSNYFAGTSVAVQARIAYKIRAAHRGPNPNAGGCSRTPGRIGCLAAASLAALASPAA